MSSAQQFHQQKASQDFYLVDRFSPLYTQILDYHARCENFYNHAMKTRDRFRADSVVISYAPQCIRMAGLNFTFENIPLKWTMDPRGYFYPEKAPDSLYFSATLPYFQGWCAEIPHNAFPRYCIAGSDIIVTARRSRSKNNGGPYKIPYASCIDFDRLSGNFSPGQIKKLLSLTEYFWSPLAVLDVDRGIFVPSQEIVHQNREIAAARTDLKLAVKHSWPGLVARRAFWRLAPLTAKIAQIAPK